MAFVNLTASMSNDCCPPRRSTKLDIGHQLYKHRLGLLQNGVFVPCSASITPWELERESFDRAVETASALSNLFLQASRNHTFLQQALSDLNAPDSLVTQLAKTFFGKSAGGKIPLRATALNLSRQDLLLDKNGHWQLVESNSIAAGMGPFCESLTDLIRGLDHDKPDTFADNPAAFSLASKIHASAQSIHGASEPLIVFLVAAHEDNVFDQLKLSHALAMLGSRVIRRTFSELKGEIKSNNHSLLHNQFGRIDGIYFRTGYNPGDYVDEDERNNFLDFRLFLEQHRLVVAPSISHQLATSKWVQMKLSQLAPSTRSKLFNLSPRQSDLVSEALAVNFKIPRGIDELNFDFNSGKWILKSQNEGGGNVYDSLANLGDKKQNLDEYLLMEKIAAVTRKSATCVFQKADIQCVNETTSELGIFTLGDTHDYGGYLLRSKPADQLEVGVHQAGGFLDTIRLT